MPASNSLDLSTLVWLKQLGIALLYLLFGYVINHHFTSVNIVSAVWPGSGLALASLLIGGRRYIWGVLFGALLLNLLSNHSLWAIAGMTLANVLEALFGAWLLTRNNQPVSLYTLKDYLRLIALGGGVAGIAGAAVGSLAILFAGYITPADYINSSLHWWMGDTLGVVLITPLMLILSQEKLEPINTKQLLESLLLWGMAFLAGQIIFLDAFHGYFSDTPKGYWLFLCVTWMAVRSRPRCVTFVILMTAAQALLGAYYEVGFFAHDLAKANLHNYWAYMMVLSVVGMTMSIYVHEMQRTLASLQLKDVALNAAANSIVITDPEGRIEWANQAYCRLTGYSLNDVCGLNPSALVKSGKQDKDYYQIMWTTILANKVWSGELINRRKDGTLYDEEMTITPLADEQGKILHFVAVKQDITERKRMEQKLRDSDAFNAGILNSLTSQIAVLDAQGIIIAVNSAWRQFGEDNGLPESSRNMLGFNYLDACTNALNPSGDDDGGIAAKLGISAVLAGEQKLFQSEYPCHAPDEKRWFRMSAYPLQDACGVVVSHENITERKLAAVKEKLRLEELAHVTRLGLIGEMASGIAHEVNQPLTAISTYAQVSINLINKENPDLTKLTEILYKSQEQALRAGRIIHSMKEFGKTHVQQPISADINTLIYKATDLCMTELKHHNVKLDFKLDHNLPAISVDPIQIEQVIINLVRNSIEALQELPPDRPRQINIVSGLRHNSDIQVSVIDNGLGIAEDLQQKILTSFYTTKTNGTGMGLSISRSLIEAHEGSLFFNSESGQGSIFYFTLPIERV